MFSALRRLFARCLPTTLAGKASAVTAVLLIITVGVAATYHLNNQSLSWRSLTTSQLVLLISLLIAAPVVLYNLISKWGRPVKRSPFPDIDEAWQPGVDAIKNIGWSLQSAPIFLVLGSNGEQMEQSIVQAMKSAGMRFKVDEVPSGAGVSSALRWYATPDAIYLFCSEVGALTQLARQWTTATNRLPPAQITLPTPAAPWNPPSASEMPRPMTTSTGTSNQAVPVKSFTGTLAPSGSPTSTLDPHVSSNSTLDPQAFAETTLPPGGTSEEVPPPSSPILPSEIDLLKERKRLHYLCQLLRRERKTHCGINGILTLLPFELTMVEERGKELYYLGEAIRADMRTIQKALALRFPVTALVVGMDRASGFGKFVGALEPRDLARRLGSGFNVLHLPTGERLRRFSDGICDAFEDWIYFLYRKQDEFAHEDSDRDLGNMKLYSLLCRMRQHVKPKLYAAIRAFGEVNGDGAAKENTETSMFFNGCYLGATGTSAEKQAFIRGIHDKLVEEQSNVQWTPEAHRRSSLNRLMTWVGWIFFTASMLALVIVLVLWLVS